MASRSPAVIRAAASTGVGSCMHGCVARTAVGMILEASVKCRTVTNATVGKAAMLSGWGSYCVNSRDD